MSENTEPRDELTGMAVAKIMHFSTYDTNDPTVDRYGAVECTEADDEIVELAFDLRPGRQRTYLRMNRADLLRMIEGDR